MGMGVFFGGRFEALVGLVFLVIFGVMIFMIVRGIGEWSKNNNSPRLTVEAEAVSRRTQTSTSQTPVAGDASGAHGFHTQYDTLYYITFQVESGDRMEFRLSGREYGMIVEGDRGRLTFQGTRFLSFERTV